LVHKLVDQSPEDGLVDTLVDELLDLSLEAAPVHTAYLGKTTLGRPLTPQLGRVADMFVPPSRMPIREDPADVGVLPTRRGAIALGVATSLWSNLIKSVRAEDEEVLSSPPQQGTYRSIRSVGAEQTERSPRIQDPKDRLRNLNSRIQGLNNAPPDFPMFVRDGYDVRVLFRDETGYVRQDDGLIVRDDVIGDGATPEDGQQATFEYAAYNELGKLIDSTYKQGKSASVQIGIGTMIPGFELGLKQMKVGGQRRIIVPPELGPPRGPSTFFSAKQWEVFDITLLGLKNCERKDFGITSFVSCD